MSEKKPKYDMNSPEAKALIDQIVHDLAGRSPANVRVRPLARTQQSKRIAPASSAVAGALDIHISGGECSLTAQ